LAYYNRGAAWLSLEDAEQAVADYDKCLKLDPKFAEGYAGRGTHGWTKVTQLGPSPILNGQSNWPRVTPISFVCAATRNV